MSLIAAVLGAVTALFTMGLEHIFAAWKSIPRGSNFFPSAHVTVLGTPLLIFALFLIFVLMVGLMGRNLADGASKWLVRLRAYITIYSAVWLVWAGIAIYGSWLDYRLRSLWYAKFPLISAWIWTTVRGVLAGKDPKTSGDKKDWKTSLGFYATVGPYVFIIGLLSILALAAQSALFALTDALEKFSHAWVWSTLICFSLSILLAVTLSFVFDINELSLNNFYRGRLVRCYLGATNRKRVANAFTGFDPADDSFPLCAFKKGGYRADAADREYDGPFPIYNATLNLVHGDELAWQERKGASFTFTPEFCGYETPWNAPTNPQSFKKLQYLGYRKTRAYAYPNPGIHLGTPMSISGAAVSPNMGFYTRSATGFLMTIFNARLGWWLGNPRHKKTCKEAGPTQGLMYLMKELLGLTTDRSGFIYVSDGGHFDNLAVYELVRRRCRFIVACDAEEDRDFAFNGLGNTIRKCREDFGVEINIQVDTLKPNQALSRSHCAVGMIQYPDQLGFGYLVYVKASIVGDEPEDVLQYRIKNPLFPHQSTGDQWFTESQFESYRRLGLHIAETTFSRAVTDLQTQSGSRDFTRLLFEYMRDSWFPPNEAIQKHFTKHAQALDDLVREMRADPVLIRLDEVLIPVDGASDPKFQGSELPKVYLFLSSVIQLMENIYLDLDLESNAEHPHNAGWIQIFRTWSQCAIFKEAWARYGWSYGRNFRRFCRRRFGLADPYITH